MERRFWSLLI
jgi:hypothetical protein